MNSPHIQPEDSPSEALSTTLNEGPKTPPQEPPESLDITHSQYFFNRELSLLGFNRRVLALASDRNIPLLERLRFLTICSTNLDEFFEVRVAGLKQQKAFGLGPFGADGLTPQEGLEAVDKQAHAIIQEQYRTLQTEILPALAEEGIHIHKRSVWTERIRDWVHEFFRAEVLPVLTPMGLDPSHPFPRVQNKSLNFVVTVEGSDAFGRASGIAVVQVPRCLPRVIAVPEHVADGPNTFVLLSAILHARVAELFQGMTVTGCYAFRVTRNADLWVEEDEVDDLLNALKGELATRQYGEAVRLEVADSCSLAMGEFLLERFHLAAADLYRVNGPVNLHRLATIYDLVDRPDLKFQPFIPGRAQLIERGGNIFAAIAKDDILLHHPYESFVPILNLVREAASDPKVLAIKMTLYRTGSNSPLVESLIEAARNGKEVTTIVEIRARFDEAENIDLATRLQAAGATIVYGIVGYKTHTKMTLIVRREGSGLKRYVHLGTGNYHTGTARAYTDLGLLTAHPEITEDVHKLFMQLTGLGQVLPMKRLLQSPFTLHKQLVELIDREIAEAQAGRKARICARMNSLSEPKIIQALYRASQAGVQIDLIVRGICCLRPGVKGLSETIRVRSVLGRFLEHSRVYHFYAGGANLTYCSSADWMPRNLLKRSEACFPILNAKLAERVREEALEAYLSEQVYAWELQSNGQYQRNAPEKALSVQEELLKQLAEDLPAASDTSTTKQL